MGSPMLHKGMFFCESHVAVVTSVRFLSSVDSSVLHKGMFFCECQVAVITGMRFLSSVDSSVSCKGACILESMFAEVTSIGIGFLSGMDPHVIDEIAIS